MSLSQGVDPFAPDPTQVGMGYGTPDTTGTSSTAAGGAAPEEKKIKKGKKVVDIGDASDVSTVDTSSDPTDVSSINYDPNWMNKEQSTKVMPGVTPTAEMKTTDVEADAKRGRKRLKNIGGIGH